MSRWRPTKNQKVMLISLAKNAAWSMNCHGRGAVATAHSLERHGLAKTWLSVAPGDRWITLTQAGHDLGLELA